MDVHIRKGKKISKANKKQNHKYCRGGGGGTSILVLGTHCKTEVRSCGYKGVVTNYGKEGGLQNGRGGGWSSEVLPIQQVGGGGG